MKRLLSANHWWTKLVSFLKAVVGGRHHFFSANVFVCVFFHQHMNQIHHTLEVAVHQPRSTQCFVVPVRSLWGSQRNHSRIPKQQKPRWGGFKNFWIFLPRTSQKIIQLDLCHFLSKIGIGNKHINWHVTSGKMQQWMKIYLLLKNTSMFLPTPHHHHQQQQQEQQKKNWKMLR